MILFNNRDLIIVYSVIYIRHTLENNFRKKPDVHASNVCMRIWMKHFQEFFLGRIIFFGIKLKKKYL